MIFKSILFLLLSMSASFTFAARLPGTLERLDDEEVEYIEELDEEEAEKVEMEKTLKSYSSGIFAGVALVGIGVYFLIDGSMNRDSKDLSTMIISELELLLCAPLCIIGIPVFGYNLAMYNRHKTYAIKKNESDEEVEWYKQREERNRRSVQVMVLPRVNFANASLGALAVIRF